MKNHQQLLHLVARAERGALLPGEAELLREAIQLLDDLATTLDKIMGGHPGDYEVDDTGAMPVIDENTVLIAQPPVKSTGGMLNPPPIWQG